MITFFFAEFLYLNPGMPLLYQELVRRSENGVRVCNVTPLDSAQLDAVIASSSVIVVDTSIYNAATWARPGEFSLYYILDQKPQQFYREALERLLDVPVPKLFALYVDIHDKKNSALFELLRGRVDAICWNFERQPIAITDVIEGHRDSWLTLDHDPTGLWRTARKYFPIRIDLPFSVADHELYASTPRHVWDICVPGAPYKTRKIATSSARRAGLSVAPFQLPSRLVAAINSRLLPAILPAATASAAAIAIQQQMQRHLVRCAPINFVCGGPLMFPVRKFFEIPAARSAMVGYPCGELEDYGFRDGWNFMASTPEEVGRTAKQLLDNKKLMTTIAQRGFDTVRRLHSVSRRADQLIQCIRRLREARLTNARFVQGEFQIT